MKVYALLDGPEPEKVRRDIEIPDEDLHKEGSNMLNLAFQYGQNDFQPIKDRRSVSVGDIIVLPSGSFKVLPVGFQEVR